MFCSVKNIIFPDSLNVPFVKISSSPVLEILQNLIHLDKSRSTPVYLQLAEQLGAAIQNLLLKPGVVLPGTRQLSDSLSLHRKTIVAAYEELSAQGLVTMVANRGTYVNRDIVRHFNDSNIPEESSVLSENVPYSLPNNRILELGKSKDVPWILDDGKMDTRLFYSHKWDIGSHLLNKESLSHTFLKHQLELYLKDVHSLSVKKDQILVTQNRAMNIAIVTQALLRSGDIVVTGAPGNYRLHMAIQQVGAQLSSIPVESDGLDLVALEEFCQKNKIRMVCVNPQNHYPNTVVTSYGKRLELLRLAHQYGFILLEDETDSAIDFQKRKMPSLVELDSLGTVVHLFSFEQIMESSWNVGFILAPSVVLKEMEKYTSYLGVDSPTFSDKIMANVLQSGNLQRTAKKMTKTYLQRRNIFCQLVSSNWGNNAQYEVPKSGLGLWINFEWDFNLAAFAKKCAAKGLVIPSHLLYQSKKWNGMRMGYGKWEEEEMAKIVDIGKQCF
ncbi:MAG: hypothetical protein DI598_01705 [Pseudopedobacter saltans]|uniref:HTH gntR-type domain-containing protein n=1 Tax=Pseudopedobacter saltans TaxID=151895 RepID=A0A2W5H9C4_9SPHI|nr:MAG: hypothetical protein DI598_01705 [Pseudopedobacter saltans]